jgi:hypothetical protein
MPEECNCYLLLADKQQLADAMLSANHDLRRLTVEGTHIYPNSILRLPDIFLKNLYSEHAYIFFLFFGGGLCSNTI